MRLPARLSGRYAQPGGTHRAVEDIGFLVAIVLIATQVLADVVTEAVCTMVLVCQPHPHGFPWGFVAMVAVLALPKALGRATNGKVWEAIAHGLERLIGRGRPAGPGEPDA